MNNQGKTYFLRRNKNIYHLFRYYMFRRVWSDLNSLRSIWLPIFCVIFALQISVSAQPHKFESVSRYVDQTKGLEADEAVKHALKNNDWLASIIKDAEADERLINQSKQRARSNISVSGLQQTFGKSHRYMVQGSIPLELGGRKRARVLIAVRKAEVKREVVEQSKAEIAAKVRKKFGEALAKALKLELTEEMLASILESYRLIQTRVKEGKTAPLDENMLLVEVNRLRSKREADETKLQIALLELRNLIGMTPEAPLKIKGDLKGLPKIFPTLGELTNRALRKNPDLLLLRAMENLADAKLKKAETDGKFDANATLGYQRLGINEAVQFNYLVFGMKFILPQRNRNQDAIEASVLNKAAKEKRRAFGELTVRQQVAKAYSSYNSAMRAREIIRVGVVDRAKENLDVVRQTYEFGGNSLLEFLDEQRRYINLKESLIKANLEVYLSKIEVYRVTYAPELIAK